MLKVEEGHVLAIRVNRVIAVVHNAFSCDLIFVAFDKVNLVLSKPRTIFFGICC